VSSGRSRMPSGCTKILPTTTHKWPISFLYSRVWCPVVDQECHLDFPQLCQQLSTKDQFHSYRSLVSSSGSGMLSTEGIEKGKWFEGIKEKYEKEVENKIIFRENILEEKRNQRIPKESS